MLNIIWVLVVIYLGYMNNSNEIKDFIIQSIAQHPRDVSRLTAERFHLNRRTIVDYLNKLIGDGLLSAEGRTKARTYKLRTLVQESWILPVNAGMEEHAVWAQTAMPHLKGLKENLYSICQHGFTEMVNNVIDHSESPRVGIELEKNAAELRIRVQDFGIGIFEKIRTARDLHDPREALLELSKGKFTTAPERHSGEGIFFTSRMFDNFAIQSGELVYLAHALKQDDWLFEFAKEPRIQGTRVHLSLSLFSTRTTQEVFDQFSGIETGFSRTHVPVALARYDGDKLVSRSQARRVLSRFEKFREVSLDFSGVPNIGQPFADEIFRVFAIEHPEITITYSNASDQIEKMIAWVRGDRGMLGPLL
ncbi:MAG: STAS-like domain-containing protein [Elusimicrobiota bacterium]